MEQFEHLFANASQNCLDFADLLDRERDLLIARDMASLEVLLAEKAPLINTLTEHDQLISRLCKEHGILPGPDLEQWVLTHASDTVKQQFQSFKDALERCNSANERNARLVRHNQQATGHLLDLLRNQGESSQHVYDSQGITSRGSNNRSLSKA